MLWSGVDVLSQICVCREIQLKWWNLFFWIQSLKVTFLKMGKFVLVCGVLCSFSECLQAKLQSQHVDVDSSALTVKSGWAALVVKLLFEVMKCSVLYPVVCSWFSLELPLLVLLSLFPRSENYYLKYVNLINYYSSRDVKYVIIIWCPS